MDHRTAHFSGTVKGRGNGEWGSGKRKGKGEEEEKGEDKERVEKTIPQHHWPVLVALFS